MSKQKTQYREFLFKTRYKNDLGIIPCDPKLVDFLPADRHYRYTDNSIYSNALLSIEVPDGVNGFGCKPLEHGFLERALLNQKDKEPIKLSESDQKLMVPPMTVDKQASRPRPVVPWLRRTEYIAADSKQYGRVTENKESKTLGVSIMRDAQVKQLMTQTIEDKIKSIEDSFIKSKKVALDSLKHPTNPELKAVEIVPIFPDFGNWGNEYLLAAYDEDPTGKPQESEHATKLESALLKPLMHADNTPSLGYFVPVDNAALALQQKRKRMMEYGEDDDDKTEYRYQFVREFTHKVVESNFPFYLEIRTDEGGAFYNKIHRKINLTKRRAVSKDDDYYDAEAIDRPTYISVTPRSWDQQEEQAKEKSIYEILDREQEE
ncbi:RNA polymerase II-associated [Gorgonomyces haynaldii]|nr:RNA polymerase II-associated [Gorgonomyces haynaldii]